MILRAQGIPISSYTGVFSDVSASAWYADTIETRLDDSCCTEEELVRENGENLRLCRENGCDYILIDEEYRVDICLPPLSDGKE